jgi:hypothetical protein
MNYYTSLKNYCFLVNNRDPTATRNMFQTEHHRGFLSTNQGFDLNDVLQRLALRLKSGPNISPSSVTPIRTNECILSISLTKTNQSISTNSTQYVHETSYRETYPKCAGPFSYSSSEVQADIFITHCLFRD